MLGGRNSQPAVQEWQADSVYAAKKCHSLTRGRTDESLAARAVGYTVVSLFLCVCLPTCSVISGHEHTCYKLLMTLFYFISDF